MFIPKELHSVKSRKKEKRSETLDHISAYVDELRNDL